MSVKIYTMTHKKFTVPEDTMYVPLQVGSAGGENLGYLCDDTGDNISEQNCYYSELTGVYWVWKNDTESDIVGICHYRRYLLNEKGVMFNQKEIEDLMTKYDVLTSRLLTLDFSYHYGFSDNHNIVDLDTTGEVIKEKYPEYYDTFEELVNKNHTYFGNICVMKKKLFDRYCEWLFDIFFEVQKRINVEEYDSYHKRVFGFISEFLLYVFITKNNLSPYECKVGMIDEKAETKEMKLRLAQYFHEKDIAGAKQYFMEVYKKRPDVLMEASDITGELRICMQIIATAEAEQKSQVSTCLDMGYTYQELMGRFKLFNSIVRRYCAEKQTENDALNLKKLGMSKEAISVAVTAFCKDKESVGKYIDALAVS
jgi:hypothetical protein